ncbi:MAG: M20 family metallo-hydrolase [Candidatus Micrarchaeaceae archaeon]
MDDEEVERIIEGYKSEIIESMKGMISIRAVSPYSGGEGEYERALYLEGLIKKIGLEPKLYAYKDTTGHIRPNITAKYGDAKGKRTLWVVAHIDTVSEGDASLWKYAPFKATVVGDRVYGRGTSDNGQDVIAAIYALKALAKSKARTKYAFGIALVADEEVGSVYGIQKLLKEKIFEKNDLILVPDWGVGKADKIEIAEKGILWLKITVFGKQVHASTPQLGINAQRYMIRFLERADSVLHRKYAGRNGIFDPNVSTFEMTKHEKNVDSINIIPGVEVAYLDCRILPEYSIDSVIKSLQSIAMERDFKPVKIKIEVVNREDSAKPTSADAPVVLLLMNALAKLGVKRATVTGIGGGTCASFFRKAGFQAAVWSKASGPAHEPNEYALISNILFDAKTFALMALG